MPPMISNHSIPICSLIVLSGHVPAFKNRKRAVVNRKTGKLMTITRKDIKERVELLESAIESALYSVCQTGSREMDLACRKRLRTHLSGLCDDSLAVVPEFEFSTKYVPKGEEGVEIHIEEFERTSEGQAGGD